MHKHPLVRLLILLVAATLVQSGCSTHTASKTTTTETPIGVSPMWAGLSGRSYTPSNTDAETDLMRELAARAMVEFGDGPDRPPKMARITANVSWGSNHKIQVGQFEVEESTSPVVLERLHKIIIASYAALKLQQETSGAVSNVEKITFIF